MATRQARLPSEVRYCYLCFDWVVGEEWEPHCQAHLKSLTAKRCGTVTHCHTLIRPGYCPLCVADKSLPASERLKSWSRDHFLWKHVEEKHLTNCMWPLVCRTCDSSHDDPTSFEFHLIDTHRFSRSRPTCGPDADRQHALDEGAPPDDGDVTGGRSYRKRKAPSDSQAVGWQPHHSIDSMAARVAEEHSPTSTLKRPRKNLAPGFVCPDDVLIDSGVSINCDAPDATASVALSPPSPLRVEDDRFPSNFERGLHQWGCVVSHDHTDSLSPNRLDDGDDPDAIFRLYLRSPSSSPQPSASLDGGESELSGVTLVNGHHDQSHDQSHDSSQLDVHSLCIPTQEYSPGSQVTRDSKDTSQVRNGLRIHLKVCQPKITLRLRLCNSSPPRKPKQAGKKKPDVKCTARKETLRKAGKSRSRKPRR